MPNHRLRFALLILLYWSIPLAQAQCSFTVSAFTGNLEVASTNSNNFALVLATQPEDLPSFPIICESDADVVLSISKPVRMKNGGPVLRGPLKSYIIYDGETYTDKQTVNITGGFEEKSIKVGVSIEDKGSILPAADNYQYQVFLTVKDRTAN